MAGFLAKERLTAGPAFSRWLIPPAALAIHLSIGQAYAFSVFNLPLSKAIGISTSAPGDWKLTQLGWIFTLAIVFLGLSAAVFGRWLEEAGPRASGLAAAACWGAGFLIGALGVRTHQLWLLLIGYGVIGGCGLGLGYITPVSALIKWFPDRRGMATGMAIMGFGGGAMIAAPLAAALMKHFAGPTSVGVAETFLVLGPLYFLAMAAGALAFRLPAPGWRPRGYTPPAVPKALVSRHDVHPKEAIRTPQFYLLWAVLCLNVTAGIGVLGQASAMIQEVFRGRIDAAAAAGFVGLLSLFNMGGRFFWSSLSDRIGRKPTYAVFFGLGTLLYAAVPWAGRIGSVALFVACFAVILTMYGGGFATIPAYLSDLFGTRYVGAIHGRLLTAWSAAGVFGPVLVNYIRQYEIERGVPNAQAYNHTLYLMAALLVVGFCCNLAVRPVAARHHMEAGTPQRETASVQRLRGGAAVEAIVSETPTAGNHSRRAVPVLAAAWAAVAIPLGWGVASTLGRALALFRR
jgi:MFS family permease